NARVRHTHRISGHRREHFRHRPRFAEPVASACEHSAALRGGLKFRASCLQKGRAMRLLYLWLPFFMVAPGRTITIDQYRSLAAAVTGARSGSVIQLPAGYRAVLPAPLTISGTN